MSQSREKILEELRALTELGAQVEELIQAALRRLVAARHEEGADPFGRRRYTPFTLLNYRTGSKAKLASSRQRLLRAIWKADFASEFSPEQFVESGASEFGEPLSRERLGIMICHLRCQAYFQEKKGNSDSARHFETDAAYLQVLEDEVLGDGVH